MKRLSHLLLCIFTVPVFAQIDSVDAIADIESFQREQNEKFRDPDQSPLGPRALSVFQGHDFFPIDLDYRVEAQLIVTEGTPFFDMKTTTSRVATERVYGFVAFTLKGKDFRLPVYQSKDLMGMPEYADYLFFPFTDLTNGNQTYGGGRYLDLRIPKEGDRITIDFNKAYNPYCAYSPRFSCPIVPAENDMGIEILAGVMYRDESSHIVVVTEREIMPEYPGGMEAMMKFISKNLVYPKKARKAKIQGAVYVKFIVEADGTISNVATVKGISPECDSEAERVVAMMPKWKPGRTAGEAGPVQFVMPIKFRL